MKASEITIEVKPVIAITDETAVMCAKLLEMWLECTPEGSVVLYWENGERKIKIEKGGD